MRRSLVVSVVAFASCAPKAQEAVAPMLPSDGTTHVAKPAEAPGHGEDPWTGRNDLINEPAVKSPHKVELPPIDQFTLSNGLVVYTVADNRLPTINVQLAIKVGRQQEPRARLGVSEAAADMLVKGTRAHDAVALARAIDFVGGTIDAESTFEATLLSCGALARDRNTCLSLMSEIMTQSTFPETELAKIKEQMIGNVRARLDDAGALASEHVQNLLWGPEHVRGWINSEQSVNALRRDDVTTWAKTWYVPNNAMLVVAGDFDPKAIKGELERAFGTWRKAPVPPTPSYKEPGLSGIRIRLVDKPGQTQTHIRIAQFGIRHDDPRFFDTLVWNYALGGGAFSSRLMKVVRVEGSKAYGASSAFDRNMDKGSLVAQTFTRNAEAVSTAKLVIAQLAKMEKDGPSDDEIAAAIANLAGGYEMRFQSAGDVSTALIGAELHGFGVEYLQNYPLQVAKVDGASARRAASEIIDPRDYVIVMVGDAKDIEPQLKKEGWRYEKVSFTDPISPEPRLADGPVDPKQLEAVKKILNDALAVKGGKAKLAAIKSIHEVSSGTTTIKDQAMPVELEKSFVLPDHMRVDATIAKQLKVVVTVAGKTGWEMAPNPKTSTSDLFDLAGNDMAAAQFEAWREPELILLKATDPAANLVPLPDDTIDGKLQTVVKLASPFGPDVLIFIDQKTKLVTRTMFAAQGQSETDDFADYRDVAGIKVAFNRNSQTVGRVTKLVVDKVELAAKIDPKTFDKPAQ
ncbi:MAG TPA: pitrilysin family protein [Kofleriaceae bacterium]|jgi:zinc protease|nr:pitrilysin family protein [Kofleriaceae bacterium]